MRKIVHLLRGDLMGYDWVTIEYTNGERKSYVKGKKYVVWDTTEMLLTEIGTDEGMIVLYYSLNEKIAAEHVIFLNNIAGLIRPFSVNKK